jgi:hypothetical protein
MPVYNLQPFQCVYLKKKRAHKECANSADPNNETTQQLTTLNDSVPSLSLAK